MKENQDKTYIYEDSIIHSYKIHDVEAGFDYKMSEFDIKRNIDIAKSLTGIAKWYNCQLDENGDIILDEN